MHFFEQGSVNFTSLSKGFKTQESYNTYIKVNKTQFVKIIYYNTSSILQCALAMEFLFPNFWYKIVLYIMELNSCLCSDRSWKYVHILHNNLHVTSYWYKISYEFKKFVNVGSDGARFFWMYIQVYVCVCFTCLLVTRFREMCNDWRVRVACLCCLSCWKAKTLYKTNGII
jgi:hypothetical protein